MSEISDTDISSRPREANFSPKFHCKHEETAEETASSGILLSSFLTCAAGFTILTLGETITKSDGSKEMLAKKTKNTFTLFKCQNLLACLKRPTNRGHFYLKTSYCNTIFRFITNYRARNNGRSTDNVRTDWGFDRSNFRLAGHVDRSKFNRIENETNLRFLLFSCFSCYLSSRCVLRNFDMKSW